MQTLQSVCRIADVLTSLQQVGNVKYTGWVLQVPCSTDENIISSLQLCARTMERELKEWKETVNKARHEFYELNYYTTIQLLTLRYELGRIKILNSEMPSIESSTNVKVLLQSISPLITIRDIRNAIPKATSSFYASLVREESTVNSNGVSTLTSSDRTSDTGEIQVLIKKSEPVMDKPPLKESDLTEGQKETLDFVTEGLGCNPSLVLKAFELYPGEDDRQKWREDIMKWCSKNINKFKNEDGDGDQQGYEFESEVAYSTGNVCSN